LITARQALEAGREVFAIPGSIHSPQSRGCHVLIKQGAKLVDSADDILSELNWAADAAAAPPAAQPARAGDDALLSALGHDPATLDALLARTGENAGTLSARLLELELEGRIARLPGGLYQRRGGSAGLKSRCGIVFLCSTCSCICTKTTGAPTPAPTMPS
jgi:DNA processing protein